MLDVTRDSGTYINDERRAVNLDLVSAARDFWLRDRAAAHSARAAADKLEANPALGNAALTNGPRLAEDVATMWAASVNRLTGKDRQEQLSVGIEHPVLRDRAYDVAEGKKLPTGDDIAAVRRRIALRGFGKELNA